MAKNLPSLFLQERGWVANSSTMAQQWQHECGSAKGRPSLRPTATRMVESNILRPRFTIGKAWSHAPDSGVETERSLALVISSVAPWRRCSKDHLTTSESQAFWILTSSPEGGGGLVPGNKLYQQIRAVSASGTEKQEPAGKIWDMSFLDAAAEDIKAEGASCTALRRPRRPDRTGRYAWDHPVSVVVMWTLQMRPTIELSSLS